MALNQKIRLQIISALDDAGIKATADQLEKLQSKVVQAEAAAEGMGKQIKAAFNPMEAVMSVASGNINGMIKSVVNLGMALKGVTLSMGAMTGIFGGITLLVAGVKKLASMFKETEEAAKKATEEEIKLNKAALEAGKSIQAAYADAAKSIDEWGKNRKNEISLTKDAERAELELAAARAKAAGDVKKSEELSLKAKNAEIEKSRMLGATDLDIAQKKYEAAKKTALGLQQYDRQGKLATNNGDFTFNAAGWEKQRRAWNGRIAALRNRLEDAQAGLVQQYSAGAFVQQDGNVGELEAQLKEAKEGKTKFLEQMAKAKKAAELIAEAKRNLDAEKTSQKTEAVKVETKALVESVKSAEDERHRLAMANIKKEADERTRLEKGLSSAKSRFEREFALYKSADKGASAIEAEKADEEARKKLQKDAARYGGKWRIDELSRLYAAGDEEGVKNRLAEWRKSSRFTPEVESMVRAAAAGENVKTMEDRVAEIAENTKGLAAKVEELLSMKGD